MLIYIAFGIPFIKCNFCFLSDYNVEYFCSNTINLTDLSPRKTLCHKAKSCQSCDVFNADILSSPLEIPS